MKANNEAKNKPLDEQMKLWLLVVSLATILLLIVAAARENFFADWRHHRRAYAKILREKAVDERGKQALNQFAHQIEQNVLPSLGRTDRCITCHTGTSDPRMAGEPQPFTTHPGDYLLIHDPNEFGCTVCHEGQGFATEKDDAHGDVAHWPTPLLAQEHMITACTRCHGEAGLFGPGGLVSQASNHDGTASEGLVLMGKRLMENNGCLGCHQLDGKGGTIGPDLTKVGDKTHHEFDFSKYDFSEHGKHALRHSTDWLTAHFENPASLIPDTTMPDLNFSKHESEALTAYVLTLRSPMPAVAAGETDHWAAADLSGAEVYSQFCSSCHGKSGEGSLVPKITSLTLSNEDAQAVASDEYYRTIIKTGRAGTEMPSWDLRAGNLSASEIDRVIGYMRSWDKSASELEYIDAAQGDPRIGRIYYQGVCAKCHGQNGEGGIGISLNSPTFQSLASDEFLAQAIMGGRPGTAMLSFNHLATQDINDILAYLRQWRSTAPTYGEVRAAMLSTPLVENQRIGKILYRANCATCHGSDGAGGIGLALSSPNVLRAVNNEYLYTPIAQGRPSTGMPAWSQLSADDIGAIMAFIRSWQSRPSLALTNTNLRGTPYLGEVIYSENCKGCHGADGRGGTGPQLANPVLMDSASDELLLHWITEGRDNTAMKGFGSKEQGLTKLSDQQIIDTIAYLRQLAKAPQRPINRTGDGDPNYGEQIFTGSCAQCHGSSGEGSTGPQLRNPAFLRAASDGFITATAVLGRQGTAMEPMVHTQNGIGQVAPENIADVVAFLRQTEASTLPLQVAATEMSFRAVEAGAENFKQFCSGCHGTTGRGNQDGIEYYAPALNNNDFLNAASDGFLLATIAHGRGGTPMKPFGKGGGGIASLTTEQVSDIVSFIRSWQSPAAFEEDE